MGWQRNACDCSPTEQDVPSEFARGECGAVDVDIQIAVHDGGEDVLGNTGPDTVGGTVGERNLLGDDARGECVEVPRGQGGGHAGDGDAIRQLRSGAVEHGPTGSGAGGTIGWIFL